VRRPVVASPRFALFRFVAVAAALMVSPGLAQSPNTGGEASTLSGTNPTVSGGMLMTDAGPVPVVSSAGFRNAGDSDSSSTVALACFGDRLIGGGGRGDCGQSNCGSCQGACNGSCGGTCGGATMGNLPGVYGSSCSTCGPGVNGIYGGNGGYGMMSSECPTCDPFCYVTAEALAMRPVGSGGFSLSPQFAMEDYEYEWAPRITIGSVPDCRHGCEFVFTGLFEWDRFGSVIGNNNIQTFLSSGNLTFVDLEAFGFSPILLPQVFPGVPNPAIGPNGLVLADPTDLADAQSQRLDTEYWSAEFNRTLFIWEHAKILLGGRYINFDEDFLLTSTNNGLFGRLASATENNLYGIQAGADILYPICCNGYFDFRGRAGIFINDANYNLLVSTSNGGDVAAASGSDEEIAGFFEIGAGLRWQITDVISLRGGVEYWYLDGVATATDQISPVVAQQRFSIDVKDDIGFFGGTVGISAVY